MNWDETKFNLRDLLADLYPTIQLSMQIVEEADVETLYGYSRELRRENDSKR